MIRMHEGRSCERPFPAFRFVTLVQLVAATDIVRATTGRQ